MSIDDRLRVWRRRIRDAKDVVGRARSPKDLVRAALPGLMRQVRVMNEGPCAEGVVALDAPLDEALAKLTRQLEAEILDAGLVDYAGLARSPLFERLQSVAAQLNGFDPIGLQGDAQRLAFWINLYNVLVLHGIIALEVRDSVMELPWFFGEVAYRVGGRTYTLDEIEHGVLRRNRTNPATRKPCFDPTDARVRASPSKVDPRIHFGLVCAAASCPAVAFYTPDQVDAQLQRAARAFVDASTRVDRRAKRVRTSLLLSWYREDFGGEAGIWDTLIAYAGATLERELRDARKAGWKLDFDRYDWSLNATSATGT